jgi:hypothetical protein
MTVWPHVLSIVTVPLGQPAKLPPPPAVYVYVALLLLLPALLEKLTEYVVVVETLLTVQVADRPAGEVVQPPCPCPSTPA